MLEFSAILIGVLGAIAGIGAGVALMRMRRRFRAIIDVDAELERVTKERDELSAEVGGQRESWKKEYSEVTGEMSTLRAQLDKVRDDVEMESYGVYEPRFDFGTSDKYKEKLRSIRKVQKTMISAGDAAVCHVDWHVEGSRAKGKSMVKKQLKLQLRAFNGECDAAIAKVKYSNFQAMRDRIERSYTAVNKLGETNRCEITQRYFALKIDELYLAHEYMVKKQEEKEEQRRVREEMREEEKAKREIEKALKEAAREEKVAEQMLAKAKKELAEADDQARSELEAKVAQLQKQLEETEKKRQQATSMAQLTKSGHVYIVSNVGSFGEDVVKIGMTRRLDPLDRVKELGDASVPFPFDIHSMIYSDNAPELEAKLHQKFDNRRVNLVNNRKEFFSVSLEEVAQAAKEFGGEESFIVDREAEEYRRSLEIRKAPGQREEEESEPAEVVEAVSHLEDRFKSWGQEQETIQNKEDD